MVLDPGSWGIVLRIIVGVVVPILVLIGICWRWKKLFLGKVGTCLKVGSIVLTSILVSLVVGMSLNPIETGDNLEDFDWTGGNSNPDIYLIIPDSYPGETTLREDFGFDNSRFIKDLEDRDFYVVEDSRSNYPKTSLTFISLLNMDYIEPDKVGEAWEPREAWLNNEVLRQLKVEEYKTIDNGSGWGGSIPNPNVDADLYYPALWNPIKRYLEGHFWGDLLGKNPYWERLDWRGWVHFQFETLKEISKLEVPTYTIMHTLGAHGPFVFAADGSRPKGASIHAMQVEQLQYMNKLLLEAVDSILRNSDIPPIIIIMSDTGSFFGERTDPEAPFRGEYYSDAAKRSRMDNFEAFYLPGLTEEEKTSFGSQVNTFRLIFNYYFGRDYEILPEKYFYLVPGLDWSHPPYRLQDITDFINGEESK